MNFNFTYDIEYNRTMRAVINDSRGNITAIKNKVGSVMKAYADGQVNTVTVVSIPYKIETADNGNLAGYFILRVNDEGGASLLSTQLRPAFEQFSTDISNQIINFIIALGSSLTKILCYFIRCP